ncbi:MAG: site-2 protease family protein [Planctomycetes bacterium]|nr:site-2 protease family protein [Planctomycetota bacterium]
MRALTRPHRIGRLFGIPVLVSPLVVALLGFLLVHTLQRAGFAAAGEVIGWLALAVASLLAHEGAHALAARRLGLRVYDICIGPLGGMVRMEGVSHRPGIELRVAAAGPALNLALASLFLLVPGQLGTGGTLINLIFGLGNLLPAFPLDGGRMVRAWLATRVPLLAATRAAIRLSHWILVATLAVANWYGEFLLALLLCSFLYLAGREELTQVLLQNGTENAMSSKEVMRAPAKNDDEEDDRSPDLD